MTLDDLYQKAQKSAKLAVEADRNDDYKPAINFYIEAADILVNLTKATKNTHLKEEYTKAASGYLDRAKKLKNAEEGYAEKSNSSLKENVEDNDYITQVVEETIVKEEILFALKNVAGLADVKKTLREAIILPIMRPDLFTGSRKPWKGILIFGPPGCGKTLIAKATVGEINATFFNISAASLVSKYLGESEKIVKRLYEFAKKRQPSIVFIDEVDSLMRMRGSEGEHDAMRRIKTQLLTGMEGLSSSPNERVVTIGATNIPWEIDSAFRRRFERRIYVPLPDLDARIKIFELNSDGIEKDEDIDYAKLGNMTEGFSGSDIANTCREAILAPVRELDNTGELMNKDSVARPVTQADFLNALSIEKPSVGEAELKKHLNWEDEYGAG